MTPSTAKRQLERITRAADRAADALGETIMRENVRPYCDRTGHEFRAGMGTWVFFDKRGDIVEPPARLSDILAQDWPTNPGHNSIGSMLPDYAPAPR